jgi:anti-sigma regulatory factor (Ser/Thr protein kinase)
MVRAVRHRLVSWLDRLSWPEADGDDVLLAVNEALDNAADHAYPPSDPGLMQLNVWQVAEADARRAIAVVTDWGRWKPPAADAGYRGRGLIVMRECMESALVQPSQRGTTVILTSRPVPRGASGG